jgi:Zn-dependent protease/CBS domain-containing protein
MNSSIKLFSVRGIAIRMHITFPLILVWAAIQFGLFSQAGLSGAAFGVLVTLLLFTIVVLHELGHSLAALRYGVPVKRIVLLPLGGVAELARIPENPRQELVIAIAGPLVNFGLAIILAMAGSALGQGVDLAGLSDILGGLDRFSFNTVFSYVFVSNLLLGVFNLLPAFPMDGGRVLRALLATQLDYVRATGIAVSVGQTLAVLMGLWGVLNGSFFLMLIAIFIFTGAGQENQMVRLRRVLRGLTVEQAYSRQPYVLSPQSTLGQAARLTFNTLQSDFPVVVENQYVGLLTQNRLQEALSRYGPDYPVGEVMLTDAASAGPDEEIFDVQQRLAESRLTALPVTEAGRLLGLITNRDISEAYHLLSSWPDLATALRARSV